MEMKFHLAVQYATQSFRQTGRFVIRLTKVLDVLQRRSRGDRERVLVNDLIARIELWHDEMNGGAIGQHAMAVGVAVRLRAGERREQSVVQVDYPPARELPAR